MIEGQKKSVLERCLQALGFEILAVTLSTLVFAWVMNTGWLDMGLLSLANSLAAMIWNVVFNGLFDRLRRRNGFAMTVRARLAHAVGFEVGLMVATLPLAMWLLDLGFRAAFTLEVAGVLFFMVYTYVYHWAYDIVRDAIVARHVEAAARR